MLEAGPQVHPEKDYKMFMWPYELPHRGVGVGGKQARILASSSRRMARGKSKASRMFPRRVRIFSGFARESSAGERITGAASRCGLRP